LTGEDKGGGGGNNPLTPTLSHRGRGNKTKIFDNTVKRGRRIE